METSRHKAEWSGNLSIGPGWALYLGPAGDTKPHSHHAVQLCCALEAPFTACVAGSEPSEHEVLLIGADVPHQIDARGSAVGLYYIEGSSESGLSVREVLRGEPARVPPRATRQSLRSAFLGAFSARPRARMSSLQTGLASILELPSSGATPASPKVQAAIRLLEQQLASPLPISELARAVALTQRELSSLFRAETGLSIRAFVLWLRLQAAFEAMAEGSNLTEAAHAAGFSDAAHLSRTFVRTFGVAPSASISRTAMTRESE